MQPAVHARVLIVDDDPVCRRFASDVLASSGYDTVASATLA